MASAQLLVEPTRLAQLRVPGEHGGPTLAASISYPRLHRGSSQATILSAFGGPFSQFQPAPPAVVIILLLAIAIVVVSWRRVRHSAAGVSSAPPEARDAVRRPRRRQSSATQCADGGNVSEHERIVRACSEQLAYLGHELRTPVTAVVGMADALSRAGLPAEQRRCVDTILSSCDALTSVVDSFLDFSRIQSDTLVLDSGDFDLRQVVDEALDMLSYPAHAKGLELEALVDSDVPVALHGDAARLRQVLVNLLGNAVRFTERGHVFLRISCKRSRKPTACLRFDVCDTGCGVSKSKRSAIFEAFVRADVPAGQLRSGIGLGLYLAKVLVRNMGGAIGVDGVTGAGSTFWFTAHFEKQTHAPRPLASALPVDRALPVLIVDDSPLVRQVLTRYAEDYGLRPCAVANGASALDALRRAAGSRDPFRLLFIDADMDDFETMGLIETVREDESLPTPELVMLTSLGAGPDPLIAALLGRYSELAKPLKQRQVAETLRQVLDDGRHTQRHTLPQAVSRTEATNATDTTDGVPLPAGAPARLRILLAEDNPVTVEVVSRLLRDVGCDVDVATDGNAAIRAARQTRYDAIFMDFQMPGLDGCQASREIHHHDGEAHLTPIIALTAHAPQNIRERCKSAGIVDYLFKPVRARQLLAVLAQHCRPHSPSSRDGAENTPARENPVAIDRLRLLFVEDSQTRLRRIREAADNGDSDTVAREAHALVGSARWVGAVDMSSACKSLEAVALSNDSEEQFTALHEVETAFACARAEFAEPLGGAPPCQPEIDPNQRADSATARA
jgi:signal transduction histidine kinase/DNA-binding response OmpR family regulator